MIIRNEYKSEHEFDYRFYKNSKVLPKKVRSLKIVSITLTTHMNAVLPLAFLISTSFFNNTGCLKFHGKNVGHLFNFPRDKNILFKFNTGAIIDIKLTNFGIE